MAPNKRPRSPSPPLDIASHEISRYFRRISLPSPSHSRPPSQSQPDSSQIQTMGNASSTRRTYFENAIMPDTTTSEVMPQEPLDGRVNFSSTDPCLYAPSIDPRRSFSLANARNPSSIGRLPPSNANVEYGKLKIQYVQGDLFDAPLGSIFVHSCNCKGVWGSGVAEEFKKRYLDHYAHHEMFCKIHKGRLWGRVQLLRPQQDSAGRGSTDYIACLFTRETYGTIKGLAKREDRSQILAATSYGLQWLMYMINGLEEHGDAALGDIVMPKINSGLFDVPWEQTEALILSQNATKHHRTIFVYTPKPRTIKSIRSIRKRKSIFSLANPQDTVSEQQNTPAVEPAGGEVDQSQNQRVMNWNDGQSQGMIPPPGPQSTTESSPERRHESRTEADAMPIVDQTSNTARLNSTGESTQVESLGTNEAFKQGSSDDSMQIGPASIPTGSDSSVEVGPNMAPGA